MDALPKLPKLPKKPSLSVADQTYLRTAIKYRLDQATNEHDPVKRIAILERARELYQTLRREAGHFGWGRLRLPVLRFAFGLLLVLGLAAAVTPANPHYRVLHQYNAYDFQLQEVVWGRGQLPFVWHGCHDFVPQFEVGFTLTRFRWIDTGKCSEIAPKFVHLAYVIERRDGLPTVPRNCVNSADKPVSCNGEPKFD